MKKLFAIVILSALPSFVSAYAKLHVGLGGGYSALNANGFDLIESYGAPVETSDTGFTVFGGYSFTDRFTMELAYYNLGTFDATNNSSSYADQISIQLRTLALSAVSHFPVNEQLTVRAKVGSHSWASDETLTHSSGTVETGSADGRDYLLSAGLGYKLAESVELTGDYTYFKAGSGSAHFLAANMMFYF